MSERVYDLHCHSTASDGILAPADLVVRAKSRGVTHLSLTDHDTVSGLASAADAAEHEGIQLIHGIEFSTQWKASGIHVVGLNIDPEHTSIHQAIQRQESTRSERARSIAERLETKHGIADAYDGARRYADGVVGRPHFARYLMELGLVSTMNAAFNQYLGRGKAGDVPLEWLDLADVISAISASGGVAVLAHPGKYKFTLTKLRRLVEHFKGSGGRAIEVVSGNQSVNDTNSFADIAEQFNMLASSGSDFHVPGQPWQELGSQTALPSRCTPVWSAWV